MLKIYAKRGTNEKAILNVPRGFGLQALETINRSLEGEWIPIDEVKPGECLTYVDDMVYTGYATNIKRYTNRIKKLK